MKSFRLLKVLLIFVFCSLPLAAEAQAEKPNFIFIMTDDQGWGDLGSYGHRELKTPEIDRLAREGTLYTHAYAPSPICSPTRAGVMTGLFPSRTGVHSQISTAERMRQIDSARYLDPAYPMLPRVLQKAGYHTMHIGKWHLSEWLHRNPELPRPDAYGFSEYLLAYLNWPETEYGDRWTQATHRARSSELFVDEAINFLERRHDSEQPFFLQLWMNDPHVPLIPEKKQMRYYDEMPVRQPYNQNPDLDPYRIYWNTLTEMDKQLGRLFKRVRESGLSENTYIIFTSDNGAPDPLSYNYYVGMGSNGPFRGEKGTLYEGGIRVPLIVWHPARVPAGRVDDRSILCLTDLLPTLAELGGAESPSKLDGEPIQEVWHGGTLNQRKRPLMWEWRYGQPRGYVNRSPMLAIRDGDWKLLINPDFSRIELYRIPDDPIETNNFAESKPDIVKRLEKALLDFHKSLPGEVVDPNAGTVNYPWPR